MLINGLSNLLSSSNLVVPDIVRLGDLDLESDTDDKYKQEFSIEEIIVHPLYKTSSFYNDIAIFKLNGSVHYDSKFIWRGENIKVKKVTVHPKFNNTTLDNNIALVKIEDNLDILPVCLDASDNITGVVQLYGSGKTQNIRVKIYGPGQIQNIERNSLNEFDETEPEELVTNPVYRLNNNICNKFFEDQNHIIDDTQIKRGAPTLIDIQQLYGNRIFYAISLPYFGDDCGFKFPVVSTKISHYIDWIDSVIFPGSDKNKFYQEKDHIPDDFLDKTEYSLEQACVAKRYSLQHKFEDSFDSEADFAHVALIGYGTQDWRCIGSLISNKHILTSYDCANSNSDFTTAGLGVEKKEHKIKNIMPICLWLGKGSVPFYLSSISTENENYGLKKTIMRPYRNEDCKNMGFKNDIKSNDQICVKDFNRVHDFFVTSFCWIPGMALITDSSIENNKQFEVPYLVGLMTSLNKTKCK
uniref:CSON008560 protein n=1 Tax=Culicoides sonorensis TaxID=179676 RepID=A0A336KIU9_CULSO